MIRKQYQLSSHSELYWLLDAKRNDRMGRFEPLISRRDAYILDKLITALHNKHTVGTA